MMMLSILFAATAVASPDHFVLQTDTSVWDTSVYDINGDGLNDVLAVCCDKDATPLKKSVAVFLGVADGAMASAPSVVCALDPSIGALFFAETTGPAPIELVATNAAGGTILGFQNNTLTPIGQSNFVSLLPDGSKEPLFFDSPMADLDGDGIAEWLVPVPSGYEVRTPASSITAVPCDVVSEIRNDSSTVITHRLPAYTYFTLPGESQQSIAFLSDEFADFAYGTQWKQHKRFAVPVNERHRRQRAAGSGRYADQGYGQSQGAYPNLPGNRAVYLPGNADRHLRGRWVDHQPLA